MAEFKVVYAIVERGSSRHWLRVGLAFVHTDGSLNVRLDAMPFNGQLQIRDQTATTQAKPDEPTPSSGGAAATRRNAANRTKRSP